MKEQEKNSHSFYKPAALNSVNAAWGMSQLVAKLGILSERPLFSL